MKELEVKIININVDNLRKKLSDINAENVKKENQINNIFDFENRYLQSLDGYARIRIVEDLINNNYKYFMTTKKILSKDVFKIMEEHEIIISDPKEGQNIFESLGLKLTHCIKKYRESYKYKNSLIEIDINDKDFCPFPYIEVESPNEQELEEVVETLGYKMSDTTSETIYELIEKFKSLNNSER